MQELTLSQANDFFENHLKNMVDKLHPGLQPLWGQMTPQHAVEHLAWTLHAANGKENVEVATPAEKLEKYKRFFYHNIATVRNYKSPVMDREKLPPLKHPDFQSAVDEFWQEWAAFEAFFKKSSDAITNNAVFGPLNEEEWRRFHFKHIVHHLTQFGVTTSEAHGLING